MEKRIRVIALYLPQFHPFKENDEWWGKGFTEWTNVGNAKPLFKGHYQPRVPKDLGYYDLRLPIIREQQAVLAREAGIEGFCYWHYWFGNGKRLMETVFNEVLDSGKPDFPFCLGWANHSWYAKNWNTKGTKGGDRILIEQEYLGESDYLMHYKYLLKAFRDKRYIMYEGMPVFMIYDAEKVPAEILDLWNKWAKEDGFKKGIYFVGNVGRYVNVLELERKGFNAFTRARIDDIKYASKKRHLLSYINQLKNYFTGKTAYCYKYEEAAKYFFAEDDKKENFIPSIIPNFDHSPRSKGSNVILYESNPLSFGKHVSHVLYEVSKKNNKLIFLKSWNEWGEGNYMEPDLVFGHEYLDTLKKEIEKYNSK